MPHLNNKQNKNTNPVISRQDLPPHSVLPIRGKTNRNSAQISPYTKLTQTTGTSDSGAETKRKKEFSLEAWGKETSNTIIKIIIIIIKKKAEKYYTNERTYQKHRSPNK